MGTMTETTTKHDVVGLSDYVSGRIRERLVGLTDEELLWEPYPGCWTIRQLRDGTWLSDWQPMTPTPPPLTTIAWRMAHLIGCYGQSRNTELLGVEVDP